MITIMRKVLVAEIIAATHLGAVADFWAAHARKRLGKLSADLPPEAPCHEAFRPHGDAEETAEFDRLLPSGWWLLPSVICGTAVWATIAWAIFA
ncbi:hypothetical protein D1114_20895 [Cereibacter sphaeroides]|uniref:Uncharacterized protein n=1 Tax=Cereibacter sphaeroides TaxID=1063 RepID=A0AAX1UFD6_CERSP|nr:hypothetical protein [Cereibacter sphaeroides]RHZ91132.1 hypothetical protein D1114_20895 [Cereibacter sphaeroides]